MNHDTYAAWASTELARRFKEQPEECFSDAPDAQSLSVFATREGNNAWPLADGLISIDGAGPSGFNVAVELKRANEGVHGILTAIGQAYAYRLKGYDGSVIVLPRAYSSLPAAGEYAAQLLDEVGSRAPVGVYVYDDPDPTLASPFENKLACFRTVGISRAAPRPARQPVARVSTQWAHVREGSTEPDPFFRYLQTAKRVFATTEPERPPVLPRPLHRAVQRLQPGTPADRYLSNTTGVEGTHDRVWREFWFAYVATPSVLVPWNADNGNYVANQAPSNLRQIDGPPKVFWAGRRDSIKNVLVRELQQGIVDEDIAWERFARKIRDRAHSYREDIDSGLAHLGLLGADGRPTEAGYRFVDAAERTGDANSGVPLSIFAAALLQNGKFEAFLHYIYRLSEDAFRDDPLAFTTTVRTRTGQVHRFEWNDYLNWLRECLVADLKVLRTATARGGAQRRPFQAERTLLRKLGLIRNFRIGVGLEIEWEKVQETLMYRI